MSLEAFVLAVLTLLLTVVSFFLKDIHKEFKELKNNVYNILIKSSARDEKISHIEKDLQDIKEKLKIKNGSN